MANKIAALALAIAVLSTTNLNSTPSSNSAPDESLVRAKIRQVFGSAVTMAKGNEAVFLVGDFDGDHSPDIAVVVTAAADQLDKLNSPYANWLIEDPRTITAPDMAHAGPAALAKPAKREGVRSGDLLLAIIHGHGAEGWRSPSATQFFLLQNSVGKGMWVESYETARNSFTKRPGFPPVRGDVIHATLGGHAGILYRLGGEYLWFQ